MNGAAFFIYLSLHFLIFRSCGSVQRGSRSFTVFEIHYFLFGLLFIKNTMTELFGFFLNMYTYFVVANSNAEISLSEASIFLDKANNGF